MDENTPKPQATSTSHSVGAKLRKLARNKTVLLPAVVVAVLVLLGLAIFFVVREEELFSVGDRVFTESDISEFVSLAGQYGVNREYALEGIEQAMIFIVTAEEHGVEVSDEEIEAALRNHTTYDPEFITLEDEWLYIIGKRLALEEKIREERNQAAKGYSFVFNFNTYADDFINPDDQSPAERGLDLDLFGNQQAVARDREYAAARAEELRNQLVRDERDAEAIIEEILGDERLHYLYIVSEEFQGSGRFGEEPVDLVEQVPGSVAEYIESFSGEVGDISEIETGEVRYAGQEDRGMYEAYYYFVYITEFDERWYQLEETLNERGVELLL